MLYNEGSNIFFYTPLVLFNGSMEPFLSLDKKFYWIIIKNLWYKRMIILKKGVKELESTYDPKDPWGWLGKKLLSKHCEGKKATIIAYNHLAAIWTQCECGVKYQHEEEYTGQPWLIVTDPFKAELER